MIFFLCFTPPSPKSKFFLRPCNPFFNTFLLLFSCTNLQSLILFCELPLLSHQLLWTQYLLFISSEQMNPNYKWSTLRKFAPPT